MARVNGPTRKGYGIRPRAKSDKPAKPPTAKQLAVAARKAEWKAIVKDGWNAWTAATSEARRATVDALEAQAPGVFIPKYVCGKIARAYDTGPEAFLAELSDCIARRGSGRVQYWKTPVNRYGAETR